MKMLNKRFKIQQVLKTQQAATRHLNTSSYSSHKNFVKKNYLLENCSFKYLLVFSLSSFFQCTTTNNLNTSLDSHLNLSCFSDVDVTWFQSYPNFPDQVLFHRADGVLARNNMKLVKLWNPSKNMTDIQLQITKVSRNDDGFYECKVNRSTRYSYTVNVEAPPLKPTVFNANNGEMVEDEVAKLVCSSNGSSNYEKIHISWFYDKNNNFKNLTDILSKKSNDYDDIISKNQIAIEFTPPSFKFANFSSQLSIKLTPNIFNYSFYCVLSYAFTASDTESFSSNHYSLIFDYGPYIIISTSLLPISALPYTSTTKSHIKVLEGSRMRLSCSVSSHPQTEHSPSWLYEQRVIPGSVLDVNSTQVDKTSMQEITCNAESFSKKRNKTISLEILYPPTLQEPKDVNSGIYRVIENKTSNFTFITQANPSAQFTWYKVMQANQNRNLVSNGSYLEIPFTKRTDSSTYECVATNKMIPSIWNEELSERYKTVSSVNKNVIEVQGETKREIILLVNYPPGRAHIRSDVTLVTIGGDVVLKCQVDNSDPDKLTKVSWYKNEENFANTSATTFSDSHLLSVTARNIQNDSSFSCIAFNEVGYGTWSSPIRVQIYEKSKLINFTSDFMGNDESKIVVNDTFPTSKCIVRMKPLLGLVWSRNEILINNNKKAFSIIETFIKNGSHYIVKSTISLKERFEIEDSGVYSCSVPSYDFLKKYKNMNNNENYYYELSKENFSNNLSYSHSTVLKNLTVVKNYAPIMEGNTIESVHGDIDTPIILNCSGSSYPMSMIRWRALNHTRDINTQDGYSIMPTVHLWEVDFKSSLLIRELKVTDEGSYECEASNSLGSSGKLLILDVKTKPETPKSFNLQKLSWETIKAVWTEGNDGGYPQSYSLLVSNEQDSNKNTKEYIISPNQTSHTINDLNPATSYKVQLQARNRLGTSVVSQSLTTDELLFPSSDSLNYDSSTKTITGLVKNNEINGDKLCIKVVQNTLQNSSCLLFDSNQEELKLDQADFENLKVTSLTYCLNRRKNICGENKIVKEELKDSGSGLSPGAIAAIVVVSILVFLALVLLLLCCCSGCCRPCCCKNQAEEPIKKVAANQTDLPDMEYTDINNVFDNEAFSSGGENPNRVLPATYHQDNPMQDEGNKPQNNSLFVGYSNGNFENNNGNLAKSSNENESENDSSNNEKMVTSLNSSLYDNSTNDEEERVYNVKDYIKASVQNDSTAKTSDTPPSQDNVKIFHEFIV